MAITIAELEYFQTVAETQNITKAAQLLHISQPSLSRSIASLEADLGVKLFERAGRNIVLNNYGELVKSYVDRILRDLNGMQEEIHDIQNQTQRTVTISFSVASSLIPGLLTEFNKIYPEIHFDILQDNLLDVEQQNRSVDLSLFSSATFIDNDHAVTLMQEDILLAIPKNDLKSELNNLNLTDFASNDFISLQSGKSLRTLTDSYCKEAGFIPRIILESDSPQTIREFIKAGYGIAFVPEITWAEVNADNIVTLPINSPKCRRYICLSWNKSGYLSPAAQSFKNYLIHHFENYARKQASKYLKEESL